MAFDPTNLIGNPAAMAKPLAKARPKPYIPPGGRKPMTSKAPGQLQGTGIRYQPTPEQQAATNERSRSGWTSDNPFAPTLAKTTQIDIGTPDQRQFGQEAMALARSQMNAPQQNFWPQIEQNARSNYEKQIAPSIAERFNAFGGQNSNAYRNALVEGRQGLEERIANQRTNYEMQQQQRDDQRFGQLANLGNNPRSETLYNPEKPGWGWQIANPLIQAASQAIGGYIGGPVGAYAGGQIGAGLANGGQQQGQQPMHFGGGNRAPSYTGDMGGSPFQRSDFSPQQAGGSAPGYQPYKPFSGFQSQYPNLTQFRQGF